MADVKISEMTSASPLDGSELLEVVQSGVNVKSTVAAFASRIRKVSVNNQAGTSYTIVLADAGVCVRMSNAAANTVGVPDNSTVSMEIGDSVAVRQVGAGQTTLVPASGVTLNAPVGFQLKTGRQGSTIMIHKVAANEWDVTGDLAPV